MLEIENPVGRAVLWTLLSGLAVACDRDEKTRIRLLVGNEPADSIEFVPVTSFAEYVELPGLGNEFRITLAGYGASCEKFVPPGDGQASVTVTIVTPPGSEPKPGEYAWSGHAAHGGTSSRPERAYALPTARIGNKSYGFPPGGFVTITALRLLPQGEAEGLLAFEFPGDGATSAKGIQGRFVANICRFDQAMEREKPGSTLKPR
ncbi:MAG TPA: hypothetical protein VF989_12195 [Polyangiaceae bacterium]